MTPLDAALIRTLVPLWDVVALRDHPADTVASLRSRQAGCTAPERLTRLDERVRWAQVRRTGLVALGPAGTDNLIHTTPWPVVTRWAASLTDAALAPVRDWLARHRAHLASFPAFNARGAAVGCGPFPTVGPLTYGQHLYREQEAAHRPLLDAYYAAGAALDEEQRRLYDALLAAPTPHVQLDLMETA